MSEAKKVVRPLPRPDIYLKTRPFWDAAKEHKLLLQFCKDTNQYQWYPRPVSIYSGTRNLEWREASGKGALYSWTNTLVPWPGTRGPRTLHLRVWSTSKRASGSWSTSSTAIPPSFATACLSSWPGRS